MNIRAALLTSSILYVTLIVGCIEEPTCDVKSRNEVFDSVEFDQHIVHDYPKYEKLESFLRSNSALIMSYNSDDCVSFDNWSNGNWDFSSMPVSILPEFMKIFKEVETSRLNNFQVCRDSSIAIAFDTENYRAFKCWY